MRRFLSLLMLLAILTAMLPVQAMAAASKPVLYNAIITMNYPKSTTTVYAAMNRLSKRLDSYRAGKKLQVTAVYPGWVEISWDEALEYTANELKKAKEKYGCESILFMNIVNVEGTLGQVLAQFGG